MKKGRISAARKALAIAVAIGSALLCAWPMNSAASASSSQDQRLGGRARPVITLQWPQFFGAGNEKSRDSAPRVLIPGGQAIGVAIRTQGVLVVGAGDNGRDSLREGDMILSVNGVPLLESAMLTEAVNAAQGQPLSLRISRGGQENDLLLTPRYDESSRAWRLGVWVRDSTAGVGTLTYYDPATGAYGALGHAITDSDTGSLLPVREGALMQAEIVDVRRGQRGAPGELRGSFLREQVTLGTVQVNTALGIYGRLARRKRAVSRGPAHGLPRTGAHGRSHDSIHHRRAGSLRIRHRDHPGIPSECRRAQIHGAARNRRAAAVFHRRHRAGHERQPHPAGWAHRRGGHARVRQRSHAGLRRIHRLDAAAERRALRPAVRGRLSMDFTIFRKSAR